MDKFNDQLAKEVDSKDAAHIVTLHPTKGYRRIHLARFVSAGSKAYMMSQIIATIERAQGKGNV